MFENAITTDSNTSREGNHFSMSFNTKTKSLWSNKHTLIPSHADEFGYPRP